MRRRPSVFSKIRSFLRGPKLSPAYVSRLPRPRQGHRTFVVSDTHFDHKNIIRYCGRPFSDVESMNRTLVYNWNSVVGLGDTVYFLGDLAFGRGSRPPGYWLRHLNGRKVVIRGSHDRHIRGARKVQVLSYNGTQFLLVHDPHDVENWNGWVIHGHKHTDSRGSCPARYPFVNGYNKTVNVNVELTGYKPVNLDYLYSLGLDRIERMNTINSIPKKW